MVQSVVRCPIIKTKYLDKYSQCLRKLSNALDLGIPPYERDPANNYDESEYECYDQRQELEEYLRKSGWKRLGSGINRSGFRKGKCVAKLGKGTAGWIANLNEVNGWNRVKRQIYIKNMFAPVLKIQKGGILIFMPYYNLTASDAEVYEINSLLCVSGLMCDDIGHGNTRKTERGKPVIVDYGFGVGIK